MFAFFDSLTEKFWKIFDFVNPAKLAKRIREDGEISPYSTYFAVHAIICALSLLGVSIVVGLLIFLDIFKMQTLNWVLGITFGVTCAFLVAHTLKNLVLQTSINRNRMTKVSTLVSLGAIILSVLAVVLFAVL